MNTPEPQGREVDFCMFVDSDHEEIGYCAD